MDNNHHFYKLGDAPLSGDINALYASAVDTDTQPFHVGDGAFIRRSDRTWRYAFVSEVSHSALSVTFIVAADGSTKKIEPRHWGNRVKLVKKREMTAPRCNMYVSRFSSKKSLRSSYYDTRSSYSFDSKSSAEIERSTDQAGGGSQRRYVSDTSSGDDSDNKQNGPVQVFDEAVSKSKQRPRRKRRESVEEMAAYVIRKTLGEQRHPERRQVLVNSLAAETTKASGDTVKTRECNERLSASIDHECPQGNDRTMGVPNAKSDTAIQNRRKPNSKCSRASLPLTTSILFKTLMKEGDTDVLRDNETPRTNRHKTLDPLANSKEGDTVGRGSASDVAPPNEAGEYEPRRDCRRATVQTGIPSHAMRRHPSSRRTTRLKSNDQRPRASIVMKGAFSQLIEEKIHSQ